MVERFYRGARAGHIPGTGMGLAIVQQIAQCARRDVDAFRARPKWHRVYTVASRGEVHA